MIWLSSMHRIIVCCFLAASVSMFGLLHPLDFEVQDGCERSCPCDVPTPVAAVVKTDSCESEQGISCQDEIGCEQPMVVLSSVDVTLRSVLMGPVSPSASENESTSVPCSSDCPDCTCNASPTMAGLANGDPRIPDTLAGMLFADWVPLFTKGIISNIFHPPRSLLT